MPDAFEASMGEVDLRSVVTRSDESGFDLEVLGRLADVRRMLSNSLTVRNLDPGNHLLGTWIDWGMGSNGNPITSQLNIPPGGQQRIENCQYMTIMFLRVSADPPLELINNANYACFYEVTKLLGNGVTQQQQIVNPWPGASSQYGLDVGQRLIVVPVGMHRFVLNYDPRLATLDLPAVQKARARL
ncbi:hypothetical protein DFR48_111100 [Ciceribacter lividus]|uniref:Uncharacterized protein n=1 Tax=Ciceribacter lividus TaxID=1197950 RepID=A0A6I7HKW3_9HYPH|nr:hypothetical protein [Ciceribacter lividus]RCW21136.1 hypothetical protein DFR48_111100 [Ciceribacter lividus]